MKLQKNKRTILAIPDLHTPFHHPDAYAFLKAIKRKYSPTDVVCLGDEQDGHAISFHSTDPNGLSAKQEYVESIRALRGLYSIFPEAKVCTSNHTSLPYRRAFEAGLPDVYLKSYKDFLQAPTGWQWADEWEIDGIIFIHGQGYSGQNAAIKAANAYMQSVVIGHVHSFAGINYSANKKHLIFGMNAGCLINTKAYAFAYAKDHKNKPILGAGLIVHGVPMFIPMVLTRQGRWIGKV